jgi:hypothetical protein
MEEAVNMLRSSVRALNQCGEQMVAQYSSAPATQQLVNQFVEGCKYACTGNFLWR